VAHGIAQGCVRRGGDGDVDDLLQQVTLRGVGYQLDQRVAAVAGDQDQARSRLVRSAFDDPCLSLRLFRGGAAGRQHSPSRK
jgi:hypothetical protein